MRKLLAIGLILVMGTSLMGCNSNKQTANTENISFSDTDIDENQSYFRASVHWVAKAENGYYFMDIKEDHVCYYDDQLQESIILCNKAACSHSDKDCMAYVDPNQYHTNIYYYRGCIYLLYQNNEGNIVLQSMEKDGSSRKDVAVLGACGDKSDIMVVFCNGNLYAYFSVSSISEEENTVSLIEAELDTGKTHTVYEYTDLNTSIQQIRAYGNQVYFILRKYEKVDGTPTLKGKGIYMYDTESGKSQKVLDVDAYDYCIDTANEKIYYSATADGLYCYDIKTSSSNKLLTSSEESAYWELSFDGEHLFIDNKAWCEYMFYFINSENKYEKKLWMLDLDGKVLQTVTLKNIVTVLYGDSSKLFAYYAVVGEKSKLCYMDKAEFAKGNMEWKSIEVKQ